MNIETKSVIESILESNTSSFYLNILESFRERIHSASISLEDFPKISWKDICNTPFLKRLYKNERLLTKIVSHNNRSALIARSVEDIEKEVFGLDTDRPLILFSSLGESLEKALWFYAHNIVPLIKDTDIEITAMTATRYKIDAIVSDVTSIVKFAPLLREQYELTNIQKIRIIDSNFNYKKIETLFPNADIYYTLSLPEVGTIASSEDGGKTFNIHELTEVELRPNLVVTRNLLLPTPIIRYQTTLSSDILSGINNLRVI